MAVSFPDPAHQRIALTMLCCLAACVAAAATPTLPRPTTEPIDLVAASSDFDYKQNRLHFQQVRITQGPMQVEAREASATGLNFENSEWTFTGDVRLTVPDGKLTASSAVVTFRDKQIASAVIRGSPAEFEQKLKDTMQVARGRSDTIDYDFKQATVRLTGAAWLTDGDNVIQGDTLVYDVGRQRVVANPGGEVPGGVRITINPKARDDKDGKDDGDGKAGNKDEGGGKAGNSDQAIDAQPEPTAETPQ
jgi:lipopolysaccharide export system protein LptA